MSSDRGRKASGRSASRWPTDRAAARRLGLLIFGVAFVALFAVVAISEGLGDPDIPDGDIAYIEDAPGGVGNISQAEFDHALELATAGAGLKKVPKQSDPQYDEIEEEALTSLFENVWVEGLAAELGISATNEETAKELRKLKDENFQTEAEFQKFVKESKFTPGDLVQRVKGQILGTKLTEHFSEDAPKPSQTEIEGYYEAAKATQFTQEGSRVFRAIVNDDESTIDTVLASLQKDNSPQSLAKARETIFH